MKLSKLLGHCLGKPPTSDAVGQEASGTIAPVPTEHPQQSPTHAGNYPAADPVDRQEIYEERAAIMEYHGELTRKKAEAIAWQCIEAKKNQDPKEKKP